MGRPTVTTCIVPYGEWPYWAISRSISAAVYHWGRHWNAKEQVPKDAYSGNIVRSYNANERLFSCLSPQLTCVSLSHSSIRPRLIVGPPLILIQACLSTSILSSQASITISNGGILAQRCRFACCRRRP